MDQSVLWGSGCNVYIKGETWKVTVRLILTEFLLTGATLKKFIFWTFNVSSLVSFWKFYKRYIPYLL